MSAEGLSLIAGAVLSLLFSYVPGLNTWFDGVAAEYKRLLMAGLSLLAAGAVYGLACAGLGAQFGLVVTCDQTGAISLVSAWVLTLIANQGVYAVTPRRK